MKLELHPCRKESMKRCRCNVHGRREVSAAFNWGNDQRAGDRPASKLYEHDRGYELHLAVAPDAVKAGENTRHGVCVGVIENGTVGPVMGPAVFSNATEEEDYMADNDGMIHVLIVEPGKKPYEKQIRNTLEELQKWVDGYIEVVYPFDDQVGIICNEEAKLDGLELNRGLYDNEGNMYDVICGRFIVVGLTEDDFGSLTEEQMTRYKEMYTMPETFVFINGRLQAFDVNAAEKAFSLAEKLARLSFNSGLLEAQTGREWENLSMGKQGEIVQKKEEAYLTALLTGESQVIIQDMQEIESRFLKYRQKVQLMAGKIGEFFSQRGIDWNYLKYAEETIEADYGMIDGIVNNGTRAKDQDR